MQRRPLLRDDDKNRPYYRDACPDRGGAVAAVVPLPAYVCCGALGVFVIGLIVISVAAATRTSNEHSVPCPPPPPPGVGACCTDYEAEACTIVENATCLGQWYGANTTCEADTCTSVPPQCSCEDAVSAQVTIVDVRPSTTADRCLDIDVAIVCTDERADPRCLARSSAVAWRVHDSDDEPIDDALVTYEWLGDGFSCTAPAVAPLGQFACFSALQPSESSTAILRLSVGNASLLDENAMLSVATFKLPGSNPLDPDAPPPCADTAFALTFSEPFLTEGQTCGNTGVFGACCIAPSDISNGEQTCFDHTTSQGCTQVAAQPQYLGSGFDFVWTPAGTCATVGCTRPLIDSDPPCTLWANAADGVTTSGCSSHIGLAESLVLINTTVRASSPICTDCDARTGCCVDVGCGA